MPTPLYNVRLDDGTKKRLEAVAKIYGAPNTSAFLREMLTSILSEDPNGPGAFLQRLGLALHRQAQLELNLAATAAPQKPAQKARSRRKRHRRAVAT